MIYYFDTSVLVAAYTAELNSERLIVWMKGLAGIEIAISQWTRVEFSSALSIKVRTRQITTELRTEVEQRFAAIADSSYLELPFAPDEFAIAARWCARHETGLRAGDALHLAIASRNEATLCTLDRKLHEAGEMLGIQTLLV